MPRSYSTGSASSSEAGTIPQAAQDSTDYSVPKKIHFIWVGGPIKEDYLHNIQDCMKNAQARGYEVNLWTDHFAHFHKPALSCDLDLEKEGLKLRDIHELTEGIDQYHGDKARHVKTRIASECSGLKNLASASDMLRIEILRQEGGIYFDTDLQFRKGHSFPDMFVVDSLGFKAVKIGRNPWINNDLIVSRKDAHGLGMYMESILDQYDALSQKPGVYDRLLADRVQGQVVVASATERLEGFLSQLQEKRKTPEYPRFDSRMHHTLHTTGPAVLSNGRFGSRDNVTLSQEEEMAIGYQNVSAQSWLRRTQMQKAFSTDDIALRM